MNVETRNKWYGQRDKRADDYLYMSKYTDMCIGVRVSKSTITSYSTQIMLLLTCNMLARRFRKIIFDIPNSNCILPNSSNSDLTTTIKNLVQSIDQYGTFSFHSVEKKDVDYLLLIGDVDHDYTDSIWMDGYGWVSGAGYGVKHSSTMPKDQKNIIGPSFAVCMAVSILFKLCASKTIDAFQSWVSLYDYDINYETNQNLCNPDTSSTLDLGNICQIGCGAIGSSLDYLLHLTTHSANINLIDMDTVEVLNCGASLLFTADHADKIMKKSDVCEKLFKDSTFDVNSFPKSYQEFTNLDMYGTYNPDIILCLANEQNIWATIQDKIPPLVLHATTTPTWGINFGRHIPTMDSCIMCRFSEKLNTRFESLCGTVDDTQNNMEDNSVLSFLPPAAATMMLAELLKINKQNPTTKNFHYCTLPLEHEIIRIKDKFNISCQCTIKINKSLVRQLRSNTKYWKDV